MWFKLAGADFSKNNLGTMSSISSSYLIDYTGLTGMSGSPSSVSYAGSSAGTSKTASVVVTVTSGYTFKQGSTITASGGKSGTVFTADKDYTGGQTFTFSMAITANTKLSGTAEATGGSSSGGNTGGDSGGNGGGEPDTPVNPPSGETIDLLANASWIHGKGFCSYSEHKFAYQIATSTVFKYTAIDVSQYIGKTIRYSEADYASSTGGISGYGIGFVSTNDTSLTDYSDYIVSVVDFPYSLGAGQGTAGENSVKVPAGAKLMLFTWYDDDSTKYDGWANVYAEVSV